MMVLKGVEAKVFEEDSFVVDRCERRWRYSAEIFKRFTKVVQR